MAIKIIYRRGGPKPKATNMLIAQAKPTTKKPVVKKPVVKKPVQTKKKK